MIEKEGFNKSFIFLLPILTQYLPYSHKYFDCIIDSYVFDSEKSFENCLIIKYKFDTIRPEFKSYEHELTNNVLHVKTLDMNENVIYVFKFPEEHLDDYFLFLEGKYSQLSKLSKTAILKFWSTIPSSYKWKEPFVIKLNRIFN